LPAVTTPFEYCPTGVFAQPDERADPLGLRGAPGERLGRDTKQQAAHRVGHVGVAVGAKRDVVDQPTQAGREAAHQPAAVVVDEHEPGDAPGHHQMVAPGAQAVGYDPSVPARLEERLQARLA
jgi:hypothetical protein